MSRLSNSSSPSGSAVLARPSLPGVRAGRRQLAFSFVTGSAPIAQAGAPLREQVQAAEILQIADTDNLSEWHERLGDID